MNIHVSPVLIPTTDWNFSNNNLKTEKHEPLRVLDKKGLDKRDPGSLLYLVEDYKKIWDHLFWGCRILIADKTLLDTVILDFLLINTAFSCVNLGNGYLLTGSVKKYFEAILRIDDYNFIQTRQLCNIFQNMFEQTIYKEIFNDYQKLEMDKYYINIVNK